MEKGYLIWWYVNLTKAVFYLLLNKSSIIFDNGDEIQCIVGV